MRSVWKGVDIGMSSGRRIFRGNRSRKSAYRGREKERTRRIWLAKCACNTDRRAKTDAGTAGNRAPHMVLFSSAEPAVLDANCPCFAESGKWLGRVIVQEPKLWMKVVDGHQVDADVTGPISLPRVLLLSNANWGNCRDSPVSATYTRSNSLLIGTLS